MTPKSVGFKMGLITAALHLLLLVLAINGMRLVFNPFFVLDAPQLFLEALLPTGFEYPLRSRVNSFFLFGTLMWFAIPWLIDRLVVLLVPKMRRRFRWIVVVISLPLVFFAFIPLSNLAESMSIRDERPEELKALLANPITGTLTPRPIQLTKEVGRIRNLHHVKAGPRADDEILVANLHGVLHLDPQYAEVSRLEFPEPNYWSIAPVGTGDAFSGQYIVSKYRRYAALLGPDGQELWRVGQKTKEGRTLTDVKCGDIDGDGRIEFMIYRYWDGIELLDDDGQILWKHPVLSPFIQIEMADIRGNGKQEIFYSHHAAHKTEFITLDEDGTVVDTRLLATRTYRYALVNWPGPQDRPHLLLPEKNQISILDLSGNEIRRLEAPACRHELAVAAVPVRFRADVPAWLAVRKRIPSGHTLLFVYDGDGQLVHAEAQADRGSPRFALAVVPGELPNTERLLVVSAGNQQPQIVEYTLD